MLGPTAPQFYMGSKCVGSQKTILGSVGGYYECSGALVFWFHPPTKQM